MPHMNGRISSPSSTEFTIMYAASLILPILSSLFNEMIYGPLMLNRIFSKLYHNPVDVQLQYCHTLLTLYRSCRCPDSSTRVPASITFYWMNFVPCLSSTRKRVSHLDWFLTTCRFKRRDMPLIHAGLHPPGLRIPYNVKTISIINRSLIFAMRLAPALNLFRHVAIKKTYLNPNMGYCGLFPCEFAKLTLKLIRLFTYLPQPKFPIIFMVLTFYWYMN